MYRVYVIQQRRSGSQVISETRTQTPVFEAAEAAFWALHGAAYDSSHLLLMTNDNRQINAYRYGSSAGERDFIAPGSLLARG